MESNNNKKRSSNTSLVESSKKLKLETSEDYLLLLPDEIIENELFPWLLFEDFTLSTTRDETFSSLRLVCKRFRNILNKKHKSIYNYIFTQIECTLKHRDVIVGIKSVSKYLKAVKLDKTFMDFKETIPNLSSLIDLRSFFQSVESITSLFNPSNSYEIQYFWKCFDKILNSYVDNNGYVLNLRKGYSWFYEVHTHSDKYVNNDDYKLMFDGQKIRDKHPLWVWARLVLYCSIRCMDTYYILFVSLLVKLYGLPFISLIVLCRLTLFHGPISILYSSYNTSAIYTIIENYFEDTNIDFITTDTKLVEYVFSFVCNLQMRVEQKLTSY